MHRYPFTLLSALTLMVSGCSLSGLSALNPFGAPAATAGASAQSLPFKTMLDDTPGNGRFLLAGESERIVLDSLPELEAFFRGRSQVSVPGGAVPPAPPEPFPPPLKELDFSRYQAIAFFDGRVKLGATSRITAVVDSGDRLVVHTTRWEPPPNPGSMDDGIGRLHIIALPRTSKRVEFLPLVLNQEVAKPGEGGVGAGGNPMMHPRWKAIPNPELTRDVIERNLRASLGQSRLASFSLEKRTLSSVSHNLFPDAEKTAYFTPDSDVWVAVLDGEIEGFGGGPAPGEVGGDVPRASQVVMLISIEDGRQVSALIRGAERRRGMRFRLKPDGDLYIGDTLKFEVQGEAAEGSLKLTLRAERTAQALTREIAYKDLSAFVLPLEASHFPGLISDPVQKLTITLEYGNSREQREVHLIRDRDVLPTPLLRAAGLGIPGAFGASPGEAALEAFARDMATTDWKGQGLSIASRIVTETELGLPPERAAEIPDHMRLRQFEILGEFPKFLIPDVVSGSGRTEAFSPKRMVIVLSESSPIHVLQTRVYP